MGTHILNIEGSLTKSRLDRTGRVISEEVIHKNPNSSPHDHEHDHDTEMNQEEYEKIKQEVIAKEGCRVRGYIVVNKVPGNFHVSSHAFGPQIQKLASEGHFTFDVSHKVNHISFGDYKDLKYIKRTFVQHGEINPLDGSSRNEQSKFIFEYYMKVSIIILNQLGSPDNIHRYGRRNFLC
jgi:hypothetical protein